MEMNKILPSMEYSFGREAQGSHLCLSLLLAGTEGFVKGELAIVIQTVLLSNVVTYNVCPSKV